MSPLEHELTTILLVNGKSKFPIGFKLDLVNYIVTISFADYELVQIFFKYLNKKSYLKTNNIAVRQTGIIYKEWIIELQFDKHDFKCVSNYLFNNYKLFGNGEGTHEYSIFYYDLNFENLDATVKVFSNLFDESELIIDNF